MPKAFHICDIESNEEVHVSKFKNILSEMKEADTQKGIKYFLGYSNFSFELWMVLHKNSCNGFLNHRKQYLEHINKAFGENFENLKQYKHENEFKRCLGNITLDDVQDAIKRARLIQDNNMNNEKQKLQYKGYTYYRDNPALSIHKIVETILRECGI